MRIVHANDGVEAHEILHSAHKAIKHVALVGHKLSLHTFHIVVAQGIVVVEVARNNERVVLAEQGSYGATDKATVDRFLMGEELNSLISREKAGFQLRHLRLPTLYALAHVSGSVLIKEAEPCEFLFV